jgi:purine-binding chemotaxis protein CheW
MNTDTNAVSRTAGLAGKYLTFVVANEEYGLPVLKVREIIEMMDITAVPQVPPYVKGVLNLRGKVIPVIDLRLKFGVAHAEITARTCIIVADVALPGGAVMMGIIVDRVSEVMNLVADEIEKTPEFGERVCTEYMTGVAKVKGSVTILLDLDRVLGAEGMVLRSA